MKKVKMTEAAYVLASDIGLMVTIEDALCKLHHNINPLIRDADYLTVTTIVGKWRVAFYNALDIVEEKP